MRPETLDWRVLNYRQQLKKMETLVAKCEQTEAAFRTIKAKLEILPRSDVVEELLRQIDLDLEVATRSTQIAREAMQPEMKGD